MATNTAKASQIISERKLQANRANARKSTGPRTPEGKAVSSRNATKHGLLAQNIILPDDPVETESELHSLLTGLMASFKPQGPCETILVERIAVCYWRLARASRFEVRAICQSRQDELSPWNELQRQVTGQPADPARHILPAEHSLDRLVRYETLVDRELHRAITQFFRLRDRRHAATALASPLATDPPTDATPPQSDCEGEPGASAEKNMRNEPTQTAFSTPPGPMETHSP